MPYCNDKDTDEYLVRKRKLTSNWSFVAREFGESIVWGKANDNRSNIYWCVLGT